MDLSRSKVNIPQYDRTTMKKLILYKLLVTPGYYDDKGNYVQSRNDLPFNAPRNQWTAKR
jgi:hypothetical protein